MSRSKEGDEENVQIAAEDPNPNNVNEIPWRRHYESKNTRIYNAIGVYFTEEDSYAQAVKEKPRMRLHIRPRLQCPVKLSFRPTSRHRKTAW